MFIDGINPFIYAAKYQEFQNGVRRMVARVTGKQEQSQTQQSDRIGQPMSNQRQQLPRTPASLDIEAP